MLDDTLRPFAAVCLVALACFLTALWIFALFCCLLEVTIWVSALTADVFAEIKLTWRRRVVQQPAPD